MTHRPLGMTWHALVVGAAIVCLVAIYVWTASALSRQHQQLVELAATERTSQLEDAAVHVAEEFEDVDGDLDFVLNLLDRSPDDPSAESSLEALLWSVRRYRIATTHDASCQRQLVVRDPRWTQPEGPELMEGLEATAMAVCRDRPEGVVVSHPLGTGDLGSLRVFARTRPSGAGVALVVDTGPMFERFRTLTADASAEMLVLGPHGLPTPASGERLARALDVGTSPTLAGIADAMRAGDQGTTVIPASEAVQIGYPNAELLVVYRPIPVTAGSPGWSAAAAVSTAGFRDHERALAGRLLAAVSAGTVVVLLLVGYVVRVARTEAAAAEQLRTADQVAHLRYRAERILDHVPSGVVALASGGAVATMNVTARQWAGLASDADAPTLWEVFPAAATTAVEHLSGLVRKAIDTGRVQQTIARRMVLFGREGTYTVLAVPVLPPSAEVAALLVVHDLTPVHDLQEQLLRAEKLATVGILAAGIAHEIGTPLGVIRGRAELVARKLGTDHPHHPGLTVIVEQIDRIARTIRALLDFASPKAVPTGEVAIQGTIERVCELVRYESDKRRVSLRATVAPDVPPVHGDPDQLQQVLLNLVMNALDATPEGGRITLAATPVDGRVSLQVADTGSGIPASDLHRVFDPFFTTKKRGDGTGLGLTVVNQIAGAHGGVVRIDSQVGRGTTVEVLLPAAGGCVGKTQQGAGGR